MLLWVSKQILYSFYSRLQASTDESYELRLLEGGREVVIESMTYFGIRHGLETLFQLVGYDELKQAFIINSQIDISDGPAFKHRGILMDSSRNFMPLDVIKNVINGLAMNKLNVFHWHITDTQSFPIQLNKYPNTTAKMADYGAYGPQKIYYVDQVHDLVTYARKRGVRIIPEFDAPAHVGLGWQYPGAEKYTVCINKEPW